MRRCEKKTEDPVAGPPFQLSQAGDNSPGCWPPILRAAGRGKKHRLLALNPKGHRLTLKAPAAGPSLQV